MKKTRKKMRKFNGTWALCGRTNRHHDLNRSRGGKAVPSNIHVWDTMAHRAFHFLFKNMTLLEASNWLRTMHDYNKRGVKLDIQGGVT